MANGSGPTATTNTDDRTSVVRRVGKILGTFARESGSLTAGAIAERTGIPRSTVQRIAGALVDDGWLERDGSRFALGLRAFELGHHVPRTRRIMAAAIPVMAQLRADTGESVLLGVLDGREVVYLSVLRGQDAPAALKHAVVGERLPAHATGLGKAMLAWSGAGVLDDYFDAPLARFGPRTIVDPAVLRGELDRARADGVTHDREESAEGLHCVAAPVFMGTSRVAVAAISTACRSHRAGSPELESGVRAAARQVSRQLGYSA